MQEAIVSECEYSRNISFAIERTNDACNILQRIVEDARKRKDTEAVEVFTQTKLIHQKAVIDLIRMRKQHQDSCSECVRE
jgi:hypothetical protein